MKRRGFTFIETMIALMLVVILMAVSIGFIITNKKIYTSLSQNVDESQNIRIALEYISREMIKAENIKLVERINGIEIMQNEITVTSTVGSASTYLYLDSEKVYIIREILRRNKESQQIVSGVKSFKIENRGDGFYTITVNGEKYFLSTNLYKGCEGYK